MDVDFVEKHYSFDWEWFFWQRVLRPWRLVKDFIWWIRYRTNHKYHVVKTGLKPGYYDADYRMFHACFNLLKNFVEREEPFKHINWNSDPESAHAGREIRQLYHWWTEIRPNRRDPVDDIPDDEQPGLFEFSYKDKKTGNRVIANDEIQRKRKEKYPEYEVAAKKRRELEKKYYKEDQENLKRLVDIRLYLWT